MRPSRHIGLEPLAAAPARPRPATAVLWRYSRRDSLPVGLALAQGVLLLAVMGRAAPGPSAILALVVALGLWWNANTVAHIHLHTPIFRSRRLNRLFALYLTALTAIPQTVWRARHLWHHAGEPAGRRQRYGRWTALELALIAALWLVLARWDPRLFGLAYLPGYVLGLALCGLHGHYEHAGRSVRTDPGISTYSRLYNLLWLNDGFHAEHHRRPGLHWTRLPGQRRAEGGPRTSAWPPVLRWLGDLGRWANVLASSGLAQLERLALRSATLQGWLIARHERALRAVLPALDERPYQQVGVVGGGLFPRSVLVLQRVWPESRLEVLDASAAHIAAAERYLDQQGATRSPVRFRQGHFDPGEPWDIDVLVVPLGLRGDRQQLYDRPAAPVVLVHDWLWRRRGRAGVTVSWLLLKRLNVVLRPT